jgi:hypothetical protein
MKQTAAIFTLVFLLSFIPCSKKESGVQPGEPVVKGTDSTTGALFFNGILL